MPGPHPLRRAQAEREGRPVWHRTWTLDATGDVRGSAMARLVSGTVALAVEAVMQREIPVGLHGAPHDPRIVARWLEATTGVSIKVLVKTLRRHRTIDIQAGDTIVTAENPLPDDAQAWLDAIHQARGRH